MNINQWNPCLSWIDDDIRVKRGEGISRPFADARTKLYALIVYQPHLRPMTVTMRAENKEAAVKYAKARWPGSEVEMQ
jgi:hypothetical protein